MKYRKKPIVIEAFRPGIDKMPDWFINQPGFELWASFDKAVIRTLEGDMKISKGDWVIKGIQGEFYPCKPDIFEKSYELVED